MSRDRTNSRNRMASTMIISGPPTNSAAVNCQPISRARMMPNSTTRLVEPISNAMAAVKLAPLRNRDRARATAAYEHDDDAAPKPAATARVRGRSSPNRDTIVERRTTACTTADSAKPRISAHRISQVIDPASANAWPTAASALLITVLPYRGIRRARKASHQRRRYHGGYTLERIQLPVGLAGPPAGLGKTGQKR